MTSLKSKWTVSPALSIVTALVLVPASPQGPFFWGSPSASCFCQDRGWLRTKCAEAANGNATTAAPRNDGRSVRTFMAASGEEGGAQRERLESSLDVRAGRTAITAAGPGCGGGRGGAAGARCARRGG